MSQTNPDDQYPPEEAQRRFESIARAIGNTRPLHLKDVPRKRKEAKPEREKPATPPA